MLGCLANSLTDDSSLFPPIKKANTPNTSFLMNMGLVGVTEHSLTSGFQDYPTFKIGCLSLSPNWRSLTCGNFSSQPHLRHTSKLIMPREGMKLIAPERSRIVGCRSPRGDEAWLSVNGEQRMRSSSTFLRSRRKRPHRRSALNRSQIVVLADV